MGAGREARSGQDPGRRQGDVRALRPWRDDGALPVRIGRDEEVAHGAPAGEAHGPRRHERAVPSGPIQGIGLTKPKSVDDLAVLNSVIRLMAQDKDEEQPLVKYARFKNDINLWYKEMDSYGLTQAEQDLLKPIVGLAYGICESQEKFMQLVQLPECGGFNLSWADRLRKAIAKKNPKDYDELTKEFFENAEEKKLSKNLCNYVWNVLVATSRGYGFDRNWTQHT